MQIAIIQHTIQCDALKEKCIGIRTFRIDLSRKRQNQTLANTPWNLFALYTKINI